MSDFAPYTTDKVSFIIKNTTTDRNKTISVFGCSILYNQTKDLMSLPGISESDIRDSLLKGELRNKLLYGDITIVFSNVELIQFSESQKTFLESANITEGLEIIPTVNSFNTIADLAAFDDSNLIDGVAVYVKSNSSLWIKITENQPSAVDNITVLRNLANTASWYRQTTTISKWRNVTDWYINSSTGSDENDGSISSPVKTFQEIRRRLGENPVFNNNVTVNIANNLLSTDRINLDNISGLYWNTRLIIRGTPSTTATQLNASTATSVSAINHSIADGAQKITITGQTWSSFIGKQIKVIGGARNGTIFYPVKDLTTGVARTSPGVSVPTGQSGPISSSNLKTITNTDTLSVISLPIVNAPLAINNSSISITIEDLEFNDDAQGTGMTWTGTNNNLSNFNRCIFHGTYYQDGRINTHFNGCLLNDTLFANGGGQIQLHASANIKSGQGCLGNIICKLDTIFQSCFYMSNNDAPFIGDFAIYDVSGASNAAITVQDNAILSLSDGTHIIYGTGIAGYTLKVIHGGKILYVDTTSIKIVASISDINFAGTNKVFGDLPLGAATTASSILVYA